MTDYKYNDDITIGADDSNVLHAGGGAPLAGGLAGYDYSGWAQQRRGKRVPRKTWRTMTKEQRAAKRAELAGDVTGARVPNWGYYRRRTARKQWKPVRAKKTPRSAFMSMARSPWGRMSMQQGTQDYWQAAQASIASWTPDEQKYAVALFNPFDPMAVGVRLPVATQPSTTITLTGEYIWDWSSSALWAGGNFTAQLLFRATDGLPYMEINDEKAAGSAAYDNTVVSQAPDQDSAALQALFDKGTGIARVIGYGFKAWNVGQTDAKKGILFGGHAKSMTRTAVATWQTHTAMKAAISSSTDHSCESIHGISVRWQPNDVTEAKILYDDTDYAGVARTAALYETTAISAQFGSNIPTIIGENCQGQTLYFKWIVHLEYIPMDKTNILRALEPIAGKNLESIIASCAAAPMVALGHSFMDAVKGIAWTGAKAASILGKFVPGQLGHWMQAGGETIAQALGVPDWNKVFEGPEFKSTIIAHGPPQGRPLVDLRPYIHRGPRVNQQIQEQDGPPVYGQQEGIAPRRINPFMPN